MRDVSYNDTGFKTERVGVLRGEAFAGEYEPVTVALVPLGDMGEVTLSISDLTGPGGAIPSSAIDVGYVSYRITRVTSEGPSTRSALD